MNTITQMRQTSVGVCAACLLLWASPVTGANILLRGKVVMQDGSAPGKAVTIERLCYGRGSSVFATNVPKTGLYLYSADVDALRWDNCALRASLRGHESTVVPISHLNAWSNPNLPDIILRQRNVNLDERNLASSSIPPNARKPFSKAMQALEESNLAFAESQLRVVVKEAPTMAEAWNYLGDVRQRLNKPAEAAQAYETATRIDSKMISARVGLLWAYLALKKWPEAEAAAESLIQQGADVQYPEIHTYRAIARVSLGKSAIEGTLAPTLETMNRTVAGEAWAPGGMKALAKMASMPREPTYQTFFEEYCRSIGRESSVGTTQGIPRFTEGLRAYFASVTELIPLGEKRDEIVVIRISTSDRERRQHAQRVLALLGWTLEESNGSVHVEPGYRPEDGLLQTVAWALGIDQITMRESLQSGAEFQFEILNDNARLVGGDMWKQILTRDRVPPGGLAAVFATDVRIAMTCAGLNAMNTGTAATIMSAVALGNLAAKHALVLYRYGDVFSITGGRADVPGGPSADPVWRKLVGADPRNPAQFFRALLEKDVGRVAAFYWTLAHADAAHQQYFTHSIERAERFYAWFRDSPEIKVGVVGHRPGIRSEFLQGLPLDSSGNVRFPGGQSAWFSGTEIPLSNGLPEALVPVARLEQKRGSPLEEQTAGLLARNYTQWAALYPYFENLPAMGREEYAALAAFRESLARRPNAERNMVLGEWYALVELIMRGAKAGSLDAAASARAFRQASLDLSEKEYTTQAVALLRQLAGSGDLEDAVAANLLRLDAAHRVRFDRTLELLHVPRIAEAQPGDVPLALSALVYAASLDPDLLLLNEDPELLRRHRYSNGSGPLFARAELHGSQDPNGTHFSGGFAGFEDAAKNLMGGTKAAPRTPVIVQAVPQTNSENDDAPAVDFRSDALLVEVYATVTDNRGRYIDDLTPAQFNLVSGKDPQTILSFESQTSDLSVALLLDTTGSMADTIASLKRAAIKLIDSLRPGDSVAVYSFSDQVTELAPYTTDRGITKRAVMNARPSGNTALYDAVARAGHELTGRSGKKVVIVFTDGRDTSSMLTANAAVERAKVAGVPVYTIAEGEAADSPELLRQLTAISNATGGVSFQVRNPDDMVEVFERVAADLAHGYLLLFQAPPGADHAFREIRLFIGGRKDLRVRAPDGYYR